MSRGENSEDRFDLAGFAPVPLFLERVYAYWKFVWKCWRTAFDWTVLLYIVVPALWIGGGMYVDWLRHPPSWTVAIPTVFPLALVGLVCSGGRFRTFAESGDALFLNRNRRWTKGFTAMSIVYAAVVRLIEMAALIALLLPVWRNGEGYKAPFLVSLVVFSILWGTGWMLTRDLLSRKFSGWWKTMVLLAVRISASALFIGIVSIGASHFAIWTASIVLVTTVTLLVARGRLAARGTFLHELSTEKDAFLSAVGWMLRDTMDKKPLPKMSRPVLLSGSRALFRRRGAADRLAESWIKSLVRRFDNVRLLLLFTSLGASAVGFVPFWLSIPVWLVLPLLVAGWLQGQWRYWLTEDFVSMFRWEDTVLEEAGKKARFWLVIPIVILWGIEMGVRFGFVYGGMAWFGVAAVPAAGWIWLRTVNDMVTGADRLRRQWKGKPQKGRTFQDA